MSRAMGIVVLGLTLLAVRDDARAQEFLLRGEKTDQRLKVEVEVDGASPAGPWQTFLQRFFAYFDFDGDGALSPHEFERLPPLASGGSDFAQFDRDDSKQVTLAEWKAGRHADVAVVASKSEGVAEIDLHFGRLFTTALDADHDGQLSPTEISAVAERLRPLDQSDDEFLDHSELAARLTADAAKSVAVIELKRQSPVLLRVNLGDAPQLGVEVNSGALGRLQELGGGRYALTGAEQGLVVLVEFPRPASRLAAAGEFLTAQLKEALASREALALAEVQNDPLLGGLAKVFALADRNQDSCLTAAELQTYLGLAELRLASQWEVKLVDRGHNYFPLLDANGDSRLSPLEVAATGKLLGIDETAPLPRLYQLQFAPVALKAWGGLVLAEPAKSSPPKVTPAGPRWFTAADANRDGVVSRREFHGPPATFSALDKSGDRLITRDEALAAERVERN